MGGLARSVGQGIQPPQSDTALLASHVEDPNGYDRPLTVGLGGVPGHPITRSLRLLQAEYYGGATSSTTSQPASSEAHAADVRDTTVEYPVGIGEQFRTEQILQQWEGRVLSRGEDRVVAVLIDITAGRNQEDTQVDLPLCEFSDDDARILRVGSVFRLLVGYQIVRGTKRRITQIIVRRLPMWTASEIDRADAEARTLAEKIAWT